MADLMSSEATGYVHSMELRVIDMTRDIETMTTECINLAERDSVATFRMNCNTLRRRLAMLDTAFQSRLGSTAAMEQPKAMVVYQAGIANLFIVAAFETTHVRRMNTQRIRQGAFRECEDMARGLLFAGYAVKSAHCNMAGDIAECEWSFDLSEAPFRESFRPVGSK